MRNVDDRLELSASDLASHLGCRHLTQLDLLVAKGRLIPPRWRDPTLEVLQQRGLELEQLYLEHLRAEGLTIAAAGQGDGEAGLERTIAAMRDGADVVYQATLRSDRWHGRADFLRRVETPSRLGAWSYEVLDAKLARETRAGTILQLCLYSHMLQEIQGVLPERMHVVMPGEDLRPEPFRVHDFLAYHRLVQRRLEAAIGGAASAATYPEPVPQCDICRWWPRLRSPAARRRPSLPRGRDLEAADPGAARPGRRHAGGAGRASAAARAPAGARRAGDLCEGARAGPHPARGAARRRAAPRDAGGGRRAGALPPSRAIAGRRLSRLSRAIPSSARPGSSICSAGPRDRPKRPDYHTRWAFDPADERAAFEAFIDLVMARWQRFPGLHIYHFAPYEPAALKRLMGRYATRESELDRLLRAERFVDLHAVVRQAVRASVERYSLKELEAFYGFEREIPLREASLHLRALERAVELGKLDAVPEETLAGDRGLQPRRLHLDHAAARLAGGAAPGTCRPGARDPAAGAAGWRSERDRRRAAAARQELYDRLAGDLSPDPSERDPEQQARWLLANMLDWHRREKKATWWEYFRLRGLSDEELVEEKAALAGLAFAARVATPARSVVDRYVFPPQECEIREGDTLHDSQKRFATVEAIDLARCTIDIRKGPSVAAEHRSAALPAHRHLRPGEARGADAARALGRRATASMRRDRSGPAAIFCCAGRRGRELRSPPARMRSAPRAPGSRRWTTASCRSRARPAPARPTRAPA